MKFKLSDIDIFWEGRDDATPDGYYAASGRDSLGNSRLWLFFGDAVSEEGYRGNILIPDNPGRRPVLYSRTGTYVTSQGDTAQMLARLAESKD